MSSFITETQSEFQNLNKEVTGFERELQSLNKNLTDMETHFGKVIRASKDTVKSWVDSNKGLKEFSSTVATVRQQSVTAATEIKDAWVKAGAATTTFTKSPVLNFFKDLNANLGDIPEDLADIASNSVKVGSSFGKITGTITSADSASQKLVKSLKELPSVVMPIYSLSSAFDVFTQLKEIKEGIDEIKKSAYEFGAFTETMSFARAITGSNELASNIDDILKKQAPLKQFQAAIFNEQSIQSWLEKATKAYSEVEESAYRLATITVQGQERSIDKVDAMVSSMRQLQEATNNTVDSVTLLNAQYDIASAGFGGTEDNLQVGGAAIALSQAGFGDIGTSANALVKIMRALGDEAENADLRAAQVFETTKIGITTVTELSGVLGPLSAKASSLGIGFNEVTAAIAALTTQGLDTNTAANALDNLLSEIASNSDQAKQALAGFTDEAGNAIQFGAGALEGEGLVGIIKQLETATAGQLPALQNIFSSEYSQQAAQLLINSGTGSLEQSSQQIQNVDSNNLQEEASNRTQTLTGAFDQALNASRVQVEDLGMALEDMVLTRLERTNKLFVDMATTSSKGVGTVVGKILLIKDAAQGLFKSITAAGGILFTVVLGAIITKFMKRVMKMAMDLFGRIKKMWDAFSIGKKEGESWIDFIKTKASNLFDTLKEKGIQFAKAIEQRMLEAVDRTIGYVHKLKNELENFDGDNPDAAELGHQIRGDETVSMPDMSDVVPENITQSMSQMDNAVESTTKKLSVGERASGAFNKTVDVGGKVGKKAFGLIGGFAKQALSTLASMGLIAGVGATALAILSGWFSTVTQLLDERTNPAISSMVDRLESLRDIDSIDDIVTDIERINEAGELTNFWGDVWNGSLQRAKGLWNSVTGSAMAHNQYVLRSLEVQEALNSAIQDSVTAAENQRFAGNTEEARTAQRKLDLGVRLSSDDMNALEEETDLAIEAVNSLVAEKEALLNDAIARGNSVAQIERLEQELATAQDEADATIDLLEQQMERAQSLSSLNELERLNTDVPINLQLRQQSIRQVEGELDNLATMVGELFNGENIDPAAFNRLLPQFQSGLDTIQLQAAIDPQSAISALEELKSIEGFDELIFSDINLRNSFNQTLQAVTEQASSQAQTLASIYTTVFDQVGSKISDVILIGNQLKLEGLNQEVEVLTSELGQASITYERQLELISQIESLEAQRSQIQAESKIQEELGSRQTTLSVEEMILQTEQTRAQLLSEEDKFHTGAVTAAEARLLAAQREVKVKKEQVALAAEEKKIEAENTVATLQSRLDRQLGISSGSGNSSGASNAAAISPEQEQVDAIQNTYNQQQTLIDETYQRQMRLIEETYANEQEVLNEAEADVQADMSTSSSQLNSADQEKVLRLYNNLLNRNLENQNLTQFASEDEIRTRQATTNRITGQSTTAGYIEDLFRGGDLENLRDDLFEGNEITVDLESFRNELNAIASDSRQGQDSELAREILLTLNEARAEQLQGFDDRLQDIDSQREASENQLGVGEAAASFVAEQEQNAAQEQRRQAILTQQAIDAAQQEAALQEALGESQIAIANFETSIQLAQAEIEAEFAARRKLVEQTQMFGDTLTSIANNDIFAGSGAGRELQQRALDISTDNQLDTINLDASSAIQGIDTEIAAMRESIRASEEAIINARRNGADAEQLAPLEEDLANQRSVLSSATSERQEDIGFITMQSAMERASVEIDRMSQVRNLEREAIDKNIEKHENLSKALEGLASAASSAFSSGAAGAGLSMLATQMSNPVNTVVQDTRRSQENAEIRVEALRTVLNEATIAVQQGIQQGLQGEALNMLYENQTAAQRQFESEAGSLDESQARIAQQGAIEAVTASLQGFQSEVDYTGELMKKQGDIYKQLINMGLERQQEAAASNESISSMRQAFASLFSNNPVVDAAMNRQEFFDAGRQGDLQRAEAVAGAQTELIDLTIMEQQLRLEQDTYANALIQTNYLSDLITVIEGGQRELTGEGTEADRFIQQIPGMLESNRNITTAMQELNRTQQANVETSLNSRLTNIDREVTTNQLSAISSNPASNADLLNQALSDYGRLNSQSRYQNIEVGSLNDPQFQNMLSSLSSTNSFVQNDAVGLQTAQTLDLVRQNSAQPMNYNGTVNINVQGSPPGQTQQQFRQEMHSYVNQAVRTGMEDMSKQILQSTR